MLVPREGFDPPTHAHSTRRGKHGGSGGVRTRSLPLARRLLSQLSYTPEEVHPVTGSGAAQSLRPISTLEA